MAMQSYPIAEISSQEQLFERATLEPVLLTKESQPSHVIMSFDSYKQLLYRLTELEDRVLGRAAEAALLQSKMVGS